MAQVYDEPLATIGRRIHHNFKALENRNTQDPYNMSLENESQRFELWAVNLGLYHLGHSSLDYRFRDAPSVFSFAYRLLRDLEKYLTIIIDMLDDEPHQSKTSQRQIGTGLDKSDHNSVAPHPSKSPDVPEEGCSSDEDTEDEESFDSYQAQPLVGLAIENTGHVIDRLYRLSFKVRNPATRMGFTKAKDFREIDQDTGVDLMDSFADYDRNHVEEVFRHYRPKLTPDEVANHFLAQRLARANTRRRQQFGQWRRHETKLQRLEEQTSKMEDLGPISREISHLGQLLETPLLGLTAPSKPSTATRLDQNKIDLDDNTSLVSTSTYAIFSQESDAEFPIPQFLKKLREKKEFECPYCHVLCSRRTAEKQAWKTHVQRDLRPYVCTYSDCKEADQQYDSFKQWVAHEAQAHEAVQCPPERRTNEYSFRTGFQAHREVLHTGHLDPSFQNSRQCPICFETPASSEHIGLHLWNIAVFSLPRSTGIEDESDQGSTDSVVNDGQSQDSRLANMENLESLSIDGEQDDHTTAIADNRENHEAPHLTIEALKDVPDDLLNGVATNVSDYILFRETTSDGENTPDLDHGSRSDSSSNPDIPQTGEDEILKAEETFKRYQTSLGPEQTSTLHAITALAKRYEAEKRFDKAGTLYQRALLAYEDILGPEHETTVEAVTNLGNAYWRQDKLIEAGNIYQRALKSYIALDDSDPQGFLYIRMIDVLGKLGKIYGLQGELIESEKLYQKALEKLDPLKGALKGSKLQTIVEQPMLEIVGSLGDVYHQQGRLVAAENMYKRALKSFGALLESDAPVVSDEQGFFYRRIIIIHSSLGDTFRQQGKLVEAEKIYQRALNGLNAMESSKPQGWKETWTAWIVTRLGDIFKEQGKVVEAEEMYQQARQKEELLKGSDGDGKDVNNDDDGEDKVDDE